MPNRLEFQDADTIVRSDRVAWILRYGTPVEATSCDGKNNEINDDAGGPYEHPTTYPTCDAPNESNRST